MPSFVRALVQHPKIDIDARDNEKSYTPLLHAANEGYVACLAELLKHPDIDLSQRTLKGNTALSAAAIEGHAACVEELVQRMTPEQIELHNNDGNTASEEAEKHMHPILALRIDDALAQKLDAARPTKVKRQKTGAPSPSPSPGE